MSALYFYVLNFSDCAFLFFILFALFFFLFSSWCDLIMTALIQVQSKKRVCVWLDFSIRTFSFYVFNCV